MMAEHDWWTTKQANQIRTIVFAVSSFIPVVIFFWRFYRLERNSRSLLLVRC